jgi:hypothetical protein
MQNNMRITKYAERVLILIVMVTIVRLVLAVPAGPAIVSLTNETATPASAAVINTSGGSIATMTLNATTQNMRWKAYVGNVTGKLALEDASGSIVYDWDLATSQTGEVYATRISSTVNWATINCSNRSSIGTEETAMNHTNNPDDNISATFNSQDHDSFWVGTVTIQSDSCYSIHTYVNSSQQSSDFEEVLLWDSVNSAMVYTALLEEDAYGFDNNTYDFQMIVPERGYAAWDSSTAYYFYVELA